MQPLAHRPPDLPVDGRDVAHELVQLLAWQHDKPGPRPGDHRRQPRIAEARAPVERCEFADAEQALQSGMRAHHSEPEAAQRIVLLGAQARLAVTRGGATGTRPDVWAMADGGRRVVLHRLDPDTCAVVETRTASVDPYDAEDLAAAPDGTLWVGDIGDNDRRRATVAVIVVPARGPAQLHRLTYPDGAHDAEALLLAPDGTPYVVTKEVLGASHLYRPAAPLVVSIILVVSDRLST